MSGRCDVARLAATVFTIFATAVGVQAQEPIFAGASATAPAPGHFILKEQFRFASLRLDDAPRDLQRSVREAWFLTTLNVGIAPELSLSVSAPVVLRRESFDFSPFSRREEGVGDVSVLAKWRIWRNDRNALDTQRLSLLIGSEIRSGSSGFSSDGYNPIIGLAYTQIAGRHGVNAAVIHRFTTDGVRPPVLMPGQTSADLLTYDLAYLYRLSPREYTAETQGALYAVVELNGLYETSGDQQLFIAPGIMWEARTYVLEVAVQVPVWQDLSNRAETDYVIAAGVRFAF
jgi:hypothetical protein